MNYIRVIQNICHILATHFFITQLKYTNNSTIHLSVILWKTTAQIGINHYLCDH